MTLKQNLNATQDQLIRSPDCVRLRLSEMADELEKEQARFKATAETMQQNERNVESLTKYDRVSRAPPPVEGGVWFAPRHLR